MKTNHTFFLHIILGIKCLIDLTICHFSIAVSILFYSLYYYFVANVDTALFVAMVQFF